jgi:hypothetical protein
MAAGAPAPGLERHVWNCPGGCGSLTEMETLDVRARSRKFRGEPIGPADPGYDGARRIHNGAVDRSPAVVARCAHADDVAAAIVLAGEFDFPLAVRATGHGLAGLAICEGGVVVDHYSGDAESAARLRAAFGESEFEPLRALKRRSDRENVFHFDENIRPD